MRFEFLPGTEPVDDSLEHFAELGEITARMHRHARQWARPAGFTRFVWGYEEAFGSVARWGRWQDGIGVGAEEREVLGRLDAALQTRLAAFGTGRDRFGLIHADTRLANLLVDDGGRVSVIDFDDSGFSWYLYDVGTSVSFFEHEPQVPGLIDAWLTGYRREGDMHGRWATQPQASMARPRSSPWPRPWQVSSQRRSRISRRMARERLSEIR